MSHSQKSNVAYVGYLYPLSLKYNVKTISFDKKEQKESSFLEINPNGRIPALTDVFDDGKVIRVFESGSIMQYLVQRYDKDHRLSFPPGSREHVEMINWLFFQNAGQGPMQGQSNHFTRYAPEKIEYGINRYVNLHYCSIYSIWRCGSADGIAARTFLHLTQCASATVGHLERFSGSSFTFFLLCRATRSRTLAHAATSIDNKCVDLFV